MSTRRPDLELIKKKTYQCILLFQRNTEWKEKKNENIDKYMDLAKEQRNQ